MVEIDKNNLDAANTAVAKNRNFHKTADVAAPVDLEPSLLPDVATMAYLEHWGCTPTMEWWKLPSEKRLEFLQSPARRLKFWDSLVEKAHVLEQAEIHKALLAAFEILKNDVAAMIEKAGSDRWCSLCLAGLKSDEKIGEKPAHCWYRDSKVESARQMLQEIQAAVERGDVLNVDDLRNRSGVLHKRLMYHATGFQAVKISCAVDADGFAKVAPHYSFPKAEGVQFTPGQGQWKVEHAPAPETPAPAAA